MLRQFPKKKRLVGSQGNLISAIGKDARKKEKRSTRNWASGTVVHTLTVSCPLKGKRNASKLREKENGGLLPPRCNTMIGEEFHQSGLTLKKKGGLCLATEARTNDRDAVTLRTNDFFRKKKLTGLRKSLRPAWPAERRSEESHNPVRRPLFGTPTRTAF